MIRYKIKDLPDDLPPGKYGCRVAGGFATSEGYAIVLKYDGPYRPGEYLFSITKDDEKGVRLE